MASGPSGRLRQSAEALAIPGGALAAAMVVFGIVMAALGRNPLEVYELIYRGAFASAFSWQNTLARAAPLVLTALCVALPARVGLMVIGGEGALVLGGLAAAVAGYALAGHVPLVVQLGMAVAAMIVGAAWLAGLPVGPLVLGACALGGAAAGLAGMVEVAAVHGSANASLIAGYGYAGILVAFMARHNPLAILPVAVLVGGISASGGMLPRRLDLPDRTVLVLQGVIFMMILASEALYGRLELFRAKTPKAACAMTP